MRALACLDDAAPADHVAAVTRSAGLDAVVVDVDTRPSVVEGLAARGLGIVVNVPLLHAPRLLAERPDLYAVTSRGRRAAVDWLHMACPSSAEFGTLRTRHIAERLARLKPDLVSLDFARGFVRWEEVRPGAGADEIEHGCCCARCLAGVTAASDRDVLADRRVELVTTWVDRAAELVRAIHPDVPVAVKVVPWLATDHDGARLWACGQDLRRLSPLVDVIMPMSYAAMIGRPAHHIRAVHDEMVRTAGLPVVPWLQAADPDDPTTLRRDDVAAMLAAVEDTAGHDFCVFHLDGIASRPDLLALLEASARHHHHHAKETL